MDSGSSEGWALDVNGARSPGGKKSKKQKALEAKQRMVELEQRMQLLQKISGEVRPGPVAAATAMVGSLPHASGVR